METPQSMLEDPSSGSKTTQYLHHQNKLFAEILHEDIEKSLTIKRKKSIGGELNRQNQKCQTPSTIRFLDKCCLFVLFRDKDALQEDLPFSKQKTKKKNNVRSKHVKYLSLSYRSATADQGLDENFI